MPGNVVSHSWYTCCDTVIAKNKEHTFDLISVPGLSKDCDTIAGIEYICTPLHLSDAQT